MELLIGSALALLFGPVLLTLIGPRARLIAGLDGFVLITVLGLVFFNIIPQQSRLEAPLRWSQLSWVLPSRFSWNDSQVSRFDSLPFSRRC